MEDLLQVAIYMDIPSLSLKVNSIHSTIIYTTITITIMVIIINPIKQMVIEIFENALLI